MAEAEDVKNGSQESGSGRRFEDLPAPAQRALREAEERRANQARPTDGLPAEINGRGGEDPARYGDWEVKGLAIDF